MNRELLFLLNEEKEFLIYLKENGEMFLPYMCIVKGIHFNIEDWTHIYQNEKLKICCQSVNGKLIKRKSLEVYNYYAAIIALDKVLKKRILTYRTYLNAEPIYISVSEFINMKNYMFLHDEAEARFILGKKEVDFLEEAVLVLGKKLNKGEIKNVR